MRSILYPTAQILTPDGTTQTFTLNTTPAPGSLLLIWNGLVQALGADYTLNGVTVTTVFTPGATDNLMAYYTTSVQPSPGLAFNPEVISLALFIQLGQANFPFKSMDRKGKIWSNVQPGDQPYLGVIELGGRVVQDSAIGLTKHTMRFAILVYIRADASRDQSAILPVTNLNAAWQAIEAALNSSPVGERQTLGGIVNNAWVNGEVILDTGILDEQLALMIPVSVEFGL
jgi:hypothetical protein